MSFNIEDHIAASGDTAFQAAASFDERVGGIADNPAAMDAFMNGGPVGRSEIRAQALPDAGFDVQSGSLVEAQGFGLAGRPAVDALGTGAVGLTGPSVPPGLFRG